MLGGRIYVYQTSDATYQYAGNTAVNGAATQNLGSCAKRQDKDLRLLLRYSSARQESGLRAPMLIDLALVMGGSGLVLTIWAGGVRTREVGSAALLF
jgi:hypothetical protein